MDQSLKIAENFFELKQKFFEKFERPAAPVRGFFAPGRVNLIGDHTDYSGGLVFPCAINFGTTVVIRPAENSTYQLASTNFDLFAGLTKDQASQKYGDQWINYPLGVLQQFVKAGIDIPGFECLYSGNVPNGAGLSSSASISVVTAFALNELFDCKLDPLSIIKMAQGAENDFVGVQCGVMDQYAVTMGQSNSAMMLDCETLECEQVPLALGEYAILLINSNQRRELSESAYNDRVAQTSTALDLLATEHEVTQLAHVSPEQLQSSKHLFADGKQAQAMYRCARHVVTEQARVKAAVTALRENNLQVFGQLMVESHASLRDDYVVSSAPLDALVEIALQTEGVLGARLTGAGFGGCTVNLVRHDAIPNLRTNVEAQYAQQTGLTAEFHQITPSQGVREVTC